MPEKSKNIQKRGSPRRPLGRPSTSAASLKTAGKKEKCKKTTNAIEDESGAEVPLLKAKKLLHTSMLPNVLLKRESECQEIRNFMLNSIKRTNSAEQFSVSRVLYISGVPGTGKTASVLKVQKDLESMKKTPKFTFLNINALELSDPRQLFNIVYRGVLKGVTGSMKKISPRSAMQFLNTYFEEEKPRRKPVVMLVDEVDMLYTKREDVLYTVFNWANMEHSRCIVVAISNTLDLPERKFSQRIVSRMGTTRLIFQPYQYQEIDAILRHRLNDCPPSVFNDKSIELAAKKVASISGDLRKALELMRRSIDIALEQCEAQHGDPTTQCLNSQHVFDAIHESQCSIRIEFLRALSVHELLLFRSLVHVLHSSAMDSTLFTKVMAHYRQLCYSDAVNPLTLEAAFHHMQEMASAHLICLATDSGSELLHRRVQLGFSVSEAQFCLRQLDVPPPVPP